MQISEKNPKDFLDNYEEKKYKMYLTWKKYLNSSLSKKSTILFKMYIMAALYIDETLSNTNKMANIINISVVNYHHSYY